MQNKTVFLLQNSKELNDELKNRFEEDGEFKVVGSSEDGLTAVSKIADKEPAFLITGLVLSGCDGISIIRKIKELGLCTKIIVLSALMREEIISTVMSCGASYFMAQPYNYDLLKERMREMCREDVGEYMVETKSNFATFNKKPKSLEEKISKIFINVGIPPHIKGYSFLREGVKMAVQEPTIINNVTKRLYPMIGERYSTSASKVERAIRHAIEVAWNRGRIDNINNILGVRAYLGAEKPTNSEFIALVADKMLLEKA